MAALPKAGMDRSFSEKKTGEFEWVAIAGPGPDERVQFHRGRPELQMITELNLRVRFMKTVTLFAVALVLRFVPCYRAFGSQRLCA